MLINKTNSAVTVNWDGRSKTVDAGAEFDVRDLDVLQSDVLNVEERMMKKYGFVRTADSPSSSKKVSAQKSEKPSGDEGHNDALDAAIAEGEKQLKALKKKKDPASVQQAKKVEKQLAELKAKKK